MSKMSVTPRNADGELDSEGLKLSLSAFRAVLARLMREYVGDRVVASFTPDKKRLLKLSQKATAPYIMVGVRSVTILKDRTNLIAMAKAGMTRPKAYRIVSGTPVEIAEVQGPHPRYVDEVKTFPVELALDVTYVDTDVERMQDAGTRLLLHGVLRGFSFSANYAGCSTDVTVRPQDPAILSAQDVDWIDMESEDQPGFQSFSIPCTMWTNLFVFGKVPVMQKLVFDLTSGLRDETEILSEANNQHTEITQVG